MSQKFDWTLLSFQPIDCPFRSIQTHLPLILPPALPPILLFEISRSQTPEILAFTTVVVIDSQLNDATSKVRTVLIASV
jgi:hypothetical protein